MVPGYVFRPMAAADLPLVQRWLALPHVGEWWGEPEEQYDLVSGDLDEPAMDQFIVSVAGSPFGYLQCYDLTAWNSGFGPQPQGTRGIDLFIGERDMIERGHGSRFIRNSSMACWHPARHASSPIPTPPMPARYAPMKRPDFAATAWSIPPMARPC